MNAKKIKQQLQREIKKNPQKAAALGLLLAVALWFWAPLVWGWLPFDNKTAAPGPVAKAAADKLPAEDAATQNVTRATWDQLARWMAQDKHMTVATELPNERNPFAASEAGANEATLAPPKPVVAWTPEQAGLVLSSTVVGARRRAAVIGGRAYAEGQNIALNASGESDSCKLVEVHPRYVVLEHNQQRFELKITTMATGQSLVALPGDEL